MTTESEIPVEERILQLLHHLGIQQAHFAASNPLDWQGLVTAHPEVIASLTIVTPRNIDYGVLGTLAPRLLVFNGDRGNSAEALQRAMASLPDATLDLLRLCLASPDCPAYNAAITGAGASAWRASVYSGKSTGFLMRRRKQ